MLKSIERQPGKKSQFLSSPLSASVSVMLGAAVTATTTTLTTVVMTTVLRHTCSMLLFASTH